MAKTLKIGVIGAGGISQVHLEGYQKCLQAEIVAVADIIESRAKDKAKTFGIPHVFDNGQDLLAMKDIDAVSICTPNINHKISAVAALQAGKHVLCEKPMAMNAREAQAMIDAAKSARRKLQIAHNNRFRGDAQFLKRIIESGKIGRPYYGRALSIRRRGVPSWGVFGQKKLQGGGPLIDIGVHIIDLTWWLMNMPRPVAVSGKCYETIGKTPGHMGMFGQWDHTTYDVEDFATAMVRFEDESTMLVESAFCANCERDTFGCNIVGESGGVSLVPLTVHLEEAGHLMDCTPTHIPNPNTYHAEVAAFVEAILKDKPVAVPAEQAIWTTKIIDGIYQSSKVNREVTLK